MKEKRFKISDFAVDNKMTVYILTFILIMVGVGSYNSTPKEKFPEVVFPFYSVTTIYPGTSPADIENLITRPIEKEIKSINGIKDLTSKSLQDFSLVFIEFDTDVDNQQAYTDVKEAVDKAKSNLPTGILNDPDVTRIDVSEIPILNINLSGDLGLVKIKEYADELEDRIEGLKEVTRVDIVGALDREIQINVDLYKMQAAGISFGQIQNAVAQENMTMSGGLIDKDGINRSLRVIGEFEKVEDLKELLLVDGVYLKDIASVDDDFAERESFARLQKQDVITINVIKKSGENLIEAIDKIKEILADFELTAPDNLHIQTTGDQSTMTKNNVSDLFNTIILGFLIVVLVLMFFMGVDNALFVAVAIPLSMLIAFIFIPIMGFTLNMVVLMAFILVLGIVVDNSIVVVENIYRHFTHTENLPIAPAAKRGVGEVALPVFTGTLTTMAPFAPLMFWPGIMGSFMFYIPATIILTLAASMFVAYVMNPVYAVSFMKYRGFEKAKLNKKELLIVSAVSIVLIILFHLAGATTMGNLIAFIFLIYLLMKFVLINFIRSFQKSFLPAMINMYKSSLHFLLKGWRPYLVVIFTVVLLFFTFFITGKYPPKVVLFPEGDPNNLFVYITMPEGTDIDVTDSITGIVENKVFEIIGEDNPDVEYVISNVALGAGENFFDNSQQPKLGKITIGFVEYKFRVGESTSNYLDRLRRELKGVPAATIVVNKEAMGPPTGKPINIECRGEDIDELIAISEEVHTYINTLGIPGIEELKSDMELNKPEISVNIDRVKANKLGISTGYIAMTLRTALYGSEVSKFREGEDEYPIELRLNKSLRNDLDALMNIQLILPGDKNGPRKIPISAVADIDHTSTYGGIIRRNHERVITLGSNVLPGYNPNEIVQSLKKKIEKLDIKPGYEVVFTGEQEDMAETSAFLGNALLIAIALIFLILVTQFNSLAKPVIIIVQILFSIIGILLGSVFLKIDISIVMTGMGIIAVAGIVVKNAIILIDYTDILIAKGGRLRKNLVDAGATRLVPVILTAASTIMGLMPLAIGMNIDFATLFSELNPHIYFGGDSAAFWKPLAWTIIFGLTFATFLTLIVVPAMYLISQSIQVRIQWKRSRRRARA